MKQQLSSEQEEFSGFISPELHASNEREGPSEPTAPTFVDDDEPLPLEATAFVTRGRLPKDLRKKLEAITRSVTSAEKNTPDADNH